MWEKKVRKRVQTPKALLDKMVLQRQNGEDSLKSQADPRKEMLKDEEKRIYKNEEILLPTIKENEKSNTIGFLT